ncbi:MAG: PAS domain S-box protein [Deltaproteobacteria bacterium]|nr:PAS domain S-box protein [Deltaproteobacteria bacterium]
MPKKKNGEIVSLNRTADVKTKGNFQRLAKEAHDAILVIKPDGKYVYANRRAAEILGFTVPEILQKNFREIVHPDDLDRANDIFTKRIAGKETPRFYEVRVIKKDGKIVFVHISGTVIQWNGNNAALVIARDITDIKESEHEVQEKRELLRATLESTTDGIIVISENQKVMTYNKRFLDMWKLPAVFMNEGDANTHLEFVKDRVIDPDGFLTGTRTVRGTKDTLRDQVAFKNGDVFERTSYPLVMNGELKGRVWTFRDVTELLKKEEELKRTETRCREIIENSQVGVFQTTPAGKVIMLNRALANMYGYETPEEAMNAIKDIGTQVYVDPEERKTLIGAIGREGFVKGYETRQRKKNGEIIWVAMDFRAVYDQNGIHVLNEGIGRDVTKRKVAELYLQESEDKYRSHFENVIDVIYTVDTGFTITSISPSVESMFGYLPAEVVGKDFRQLRHIIPSRHLEKALSNMKRIFKGERVIDSEYEIIAKDGRIVPVEVCGAPIIREGVLVGSASVVRDITRRERIQKELRESEQRYRQLVEFAPAAIYEINYETRKFISVNDIICQYLGYTRDELLKMDFVNIMEDESKALLFERIKDIEKGGNTSITAEYKFIRKDGTIIWGLVNSRYTVENGKITHAFGVAYDITERKLIEEKIRQSEERLRTVLENMPIMLVAVDENDHVLVWNHECERVSGYLEDEIAKHENFWGVLYPDESYKEQLLSIWDGGRREFIGLEVGMTCKDGTKRLVSWSNISPRYTVPGWHSWTVGFDVTKIRESEKDLIRKKTELKAVVNNIPDIVWLKDCNLRYVIINHYLELLSGVTIDEAAGRRDPLCVPEGLQEKALERDRQVLNTGQVLKYEEEIIDKNGMSHVVETIRTPIMDESSSVIGIVGVCHDITDQRKKEEQFSRQFLELEMNLQEKSYELLELTEELEQSREELVAKKTELEVVGKQVLENSKALSVLVKNMESVKKEAEQNIINEARRIITPIVQRLERDKELERHRTDLNILKKHLDDLSSRLSYTRFATALSSTEIQIASMIRNGMSSDDIASRLSISVNTVKTHRRNIRRKLKLQNSSVNLVSYLQAEF